MANRYASDYYDGRSQFERTERSFPHYDRYDRYDRYSQYERSPPPSRNISRHNDRAAEPARGDGFEFRGAAERDGYRPRQHEEDFTFRPQGQPAPRFPSPDRHAPLPLQHSRARGVEISRGGHRRQGPAGQHGGRTHVGRPPRRFGKPPPHQRDILQGAHRGSTPEQLHGMNAGGQTRFTALDTSSDDENVIDLTHDDSDDDIDADALRKRVKAESSFSIGQGAPKWSNPEYFTALPPPETLGAPKKDIVQVIRKAKVDSASKDDSSANAVKDNDDFISFNLDDEGESMSESDSVSENKPPSNAPVGPSGLGRRGTMQKNSMQGPNGHQLQSDAPPSTFQPINLRSANKMKNTLGPPPPPPADLIMPTEEELIEQYGGDTKGKKRKRVDQSRDIGDVLPEWQTNDTEPTPWCTVDHSRTAIVGLRLHKEIADFYEFVRPYAYEEEVRRDLINRVQRAVRGAPNKVGGGSAEIKSFGSFAAGLYLPTADMDLVALSPDYLRYGTKVICQTNSRIHALGSHVANVGLAAEGTMSPVTKAKVPLVKFTDRQTGIKVDISFENDSGVKAIQTFLAWKEKYPAMPVIVVLIKQMLAMRGLNEVFTGGLGGFSIICLVVSMMQLMPEVQSGNLDPQQHYGQLLLNFLDLYGNKFNIKATGITMEPPGHYDKVKNPRSKQNANNLTIIDPNNPNNDISGGSRNVGAIFALFRTAHSEIQRRLGQIHSGQKVNESILGCIWGGNYSSFIHQRNKLSLLHRGHAVSPPPVPKRVPQQQFPPSKRQRQAPVPQRQQNQRPQRPLPPREQSRPQGPPKQQVQHGRMQHPLPQRPPEDSRPNQKRYVTIYSAPPSNTSK